MRDSLLFAASVLLAGAGCSQRQLTPAPQADRVVGQENAARDQANGVTVVLQPNHWEGDPPNLRNVVLPVHVSLRNESGHPLQIAYRRFHVVTGSGFEAAALPPFKIEGSVARTTPTTFVTPFYGWNRFHIAITRTTTDRRGRRGAARGRSITLTTPGTARGASLCRLRTCCARRCQKGVLDTGGDVSGFIYFQRLPEEVQRVELRARLLDAETEQTVAAMSIPFVVTD